MSLPTPKTQHLSPEQRKLLETTVLRAREVAEAGARAAIQALAVDRREPFPEMDPEARALRVRLRARARQLGDRLPPQHPSPNTHHLISECAYEHWHRMLFARFLAENNVLMHPDGVAVTLEECEELAPDEGAEDGWELAARYAAEMLPQIFRPDAPVLEVTLPPERQRELERLLADLPPEVFKASDSLGWVYQFWQAKKKDEVNKSEVKIGADELPAVTQLFTEPYMVQFLLHNTLGAWWVGKQVIGDGCWVMGEKTDAEAEEELRDRFTVNGYRFDYLRFVKVPEANEPNAYHPIPITQPNTQHPTPITLFRPAAGTFEGWPRSAAELKVLDPCCGSGHFLVAAFEILVHFRMAEENLSPAEACDAVLRDNIHGLEIDERCTQIAAFALALAAWTFPGAGGHRVLPEMHIACSGLAPRAKKSEWLALAGEDSRVRGGMEWMHRLFDDAPILGSLIDPARQQPDPLLVAGLEELAPILSRALRAEAQSDADLQERRVTAAGLAKAGEFLATQYHLVATNVPYLLRRKQHPRLLQFLKDYHPNAVNDLAIAFADRIQRFLRRRGCSALVLPQSFIEIRSYQTLRRRLLTNEKWRLVARVGPGAFRTISGEVVNVCLTVLENTTPDPTHTVWSIDVNNENGASAKDRGLRTNQLDGVAQAALKANPEARFTLLASGASSGLGAVAAASWGVSPADLRRFGRFFWELAQQGQPWVRWQSSFKTTVPYAGRQLLLNMGPDLQAAVDAGKALLRGKEYWGRPSVVATVMGDIPCTIGTGEPVDTNVATIVPNDEELLPALWAYCESGEFSANVRKLYGGLKVTSGTLPQVPFDVARWKAIAAERYPHGLPEPYSEDPTQWVFMGTVRPSTEPLQVAVARLLGYSWSEQVDDDLDDLIDDDGIVCLPAVRGEQPAATRLQRMLARAFGDEWSPHKQAELLAAVGCKGWTLERWLQDKFFAQHCKVFQNRPFIWHIWDGLRKGGFSALVNYHKLDRKLLETLTYNYLGDWIRRQQDGVKRGENGAADRLAAAKGLQEKLKLILKGEPPCDIFVRWKPIEEQPMGWDPDINDGVRVNIRPFMLVGDVGKKGAGVLRDKPNIKWGKDRGKDPPDAPWYHLGPQYGLPEGTRINDHHLTLAEKQAARHAKESQS